MNEAEWRAARNSRSLRYAGRVLDPDKRVHLRADPAYAARYDGQVAILVAANLFGRMTPALALDIPSVPVVAPLPWAGVDLREYVLKQLYAADPFGKFAQCNASDGDYIIHLGRAGASAVVHGSGWNLYAGPAPSPLADDETANPVGPAMAAILAGAEAFRSALSHPAAFQLNALTWHAGMATAADAPLPTALSPGALWFVGLGSVGTAVLYFLTLATRDFSARLFDMDKVKIHNLDRSPLFMDRHVRWQKVDAAAEYLRGLGITAVEPEPFALDESPAWTGRPLGVPDVLISAANERNVRAVIESNFPPLQIYATTGRNWQAAVIRHAPFEDPCSCCLFPETAHAPTTCATGSLPQASNGEQMDAALPFLSFAAGVMAAAEILKRGLPGYPFVSNRVVLNTSPRIRTVPAALSLRSSCICQKRSSTVHRQMLDLPV
ncbi:ThiF family adenylyltransferase [Parvibaculum sp.]|uniref:ThiF family adenylyltransferase n=1 Tax=Parvibaculum sp. TaxID=2024848 RepID=UPI00273706A7|nr:ThiF family adenylyltransferase [Parvibaculum sp.]MDP3328963.1 ThiF family adenylyltransferase [Parvibaculum sp.]